ncbi:hypothetical protein [Tepidibacillus marianensis]|uniref:hypothetical protein n=1 Tax=Tepidibacillus marianensis TaxID=3131995 RepID=UPI0030D31DFC
MNAWMGLLKKDYRLGRTGLIGTLIVEIVIMMLAYIFTIKWQNPGIIVAPVAMLFFLIFFIYPLIYFLV